jgi:hypothetical protein
MFLALVAAVFRVLGALCGLIATSAWAVSRLRRRPAWRPGWPIQRSPWW